VEAVLDALRAWPGVESVGVANRFPVGHGTVARHEFWKTTGIGGHHVGVGGDFFRTLRTPLLAGREFTDRDVASRALVAILNVSGVRALWPGEPAAAAIGKTLQTRDGERRVVGVIPDIRSRPGEATSPGLYVPLTAAEAQTSASAIAVALRMAPGHTPNAMALDAWLDERLGRQFARVEAVADLVTPHLQRPRFQAFLFGSFALIALCLAAVGLYAVAAFDVARRRYEIGVRLTMGATGGDIRRLVIRGAVGGPRSSCRRSSSKSTRAIRGRTRSWR
jgi:hypothetical protein